MSASHYADYAFPVGIAALLWREVVGYEPVVFVCGEWTGKAIVAREFMAEHLIETLDIPAMEEWPVHVTAQNVRYHAASLFRDQWLMLSDADLFPLRRDFYHQHEDFDGRFCFYFSNGDSGLRYPTCHIVARSEHWCEVMGINEHGNLLGQMRRNIAPWIESVTHGKSPSEAGMAVWVTDMHMFAARIKAMPWYPVHCKMIEREGHPPVDRLDRSNWPANYNVSNYVDAHILRATHEPRNWERTRPILEALIPQHLESIDRYVTAFRGA